MSALASALAQSGVQASELQAMLLAEKKRRLSENRLAAYLPYAKQREFHALGATKRERGLIAGNQLGKTLSAGMEVSMHLTGRYPGWWVGYRFRHPIVAWVGGVTAEATRDGAQRILLGRGGANEEGTLGTGTIPAACLIGKPLSRQGIAGAYAVAYVRHVTGGVSTLIFKSYDQGREKWQSDTIDVLWDDEEPPENIYSEGLTRTNHGDEGRGGIALLTFTPLLGMSSVVRRFLLEPSPDRSHVTMTIDDVDHYTPEQKAKIVAGYLAHERKARARGEPVLGSGRVFTVDEDRIKWDPVPLPKHVKRIVGLDFGWDHPTAASWMAWDPDPDIIYVTDCYRVAQQPVIIHAAAIKARDKTNQIPVAWPHDGLQHDKGSGEQIAKQYRDQGVNMLPERATFEDDGGNGVEAGVSDMLDRMETDRWRVARHLEDWFSEYRLYHREDGQIVKEYDDLLCSGRYGMMMRRFAREIKAPKDAYRSRGSSHQSWLTA